MPRGPRAGLRVRLLAGMLVVVAVGAGALFVVVGLVAPSAFEAAMGHGAGGMGGMGEMMDPLLRTAFRDAVWQALVIATVAAVGAAVLVSAAVSERLARPIRHVAAASRRIADGHYAERVPVVTADEIGALAGSFNQMAEALESNERRRLELVGDVAHELRTPLATLDGYLEGLEDGVVPANEASWALLRNETARLARLVDDLQELWRTEARQVPMRFAAVEVGPVVEEVLERWRPVAEARGIVLRREGEGALPAVRADRERLAQVMDNLVSNAIRYAPDGSAVVVPARRGANEVIVGVRDEGPGLTAEQLSRVFERFYRVDPSRSRALGGSGIGLAIAKALTEAMDGRIWAESPGPGLGTTFSVALPLAG